jgi:hypothetical protein
VWPAARAPMVHGEGVGQPQWNGGSPKGHDVSQGRGDGGQRRLAMAAALH